MHRFWKPLGYALLFLAASVGLYHGWRVFWFLTDDAYITFRYVSNSLLGYGYVWNAPPFRPVEGYTSFLWAVLLEGVWRLTGIAPPDSANWLALGFAYGTTGLGGGMALRIALPPVWQKWRWALMALFLLGLLTNRTYLTWASSGLETAMFNFFFTAWFAAGWWGNLRQQRWQLALSGTAALMALTRPDGLLFIAATVGLLVIRYWLSAPNVHNQSVLSVSSVSQAFKSSLFSSLPFLLNLAHFLWRYATYGEWLPNTFAAKYVAPWVESGGRYALAFIIEYGLWGWLALVAVFLGWQLTKITASGFSSVFSASSVVKLLLLAAIGAHWAYYTFIIGGDHFEYRVYSQWPLLIGLSTLALLPALRLPPRWGLALNLILVLLSWPMQWTHWSLTHTLESRAETMNLKVPLAPHLPAWARPYGQWFDDLEFWLITHGVGVRHQEHKMLALNQLAILPTREAGLLLNPGQTPILIEGAVGVMGWVLPTTAIVDWHGLNDYVIARHPADANFPRFMAHDRYPPAGYVECFRANVQVAYQRFIIAPPVENIAEMVRHCEQQKWPVTPWEPNRPIPNLNVAAGAWRWLGDWWTPEPLLVAYADLTRPVPQTAPQTLTTLEQQYPGLGCMVFPTAPNPADYALLFLPADSRPSLADVQALFPWAKFVTEDHLTPGLAYNLAYAAPLTETLQPRPQTPYALRWETTELWGYSLPPALRPGTPLTLTLYWRTTAPPAQNAGFSAQLVNRAHPETPLAQSLGEVCSSGFPLPRWTPDLTIVTQAVLWLPDDISAGDYAVQVNLFDWPTGANLPVTGAPQLPTGLTTP